MIVRVDHDKPAALGLADAEKEPGIGFLVDLYVFGRRRANRMAHHSAWPVIVIKHGIEKNAAVRRPDHVALSVGQFVGQHIACLKIPDTDLAVLRPVAVDGSSKHPVIGRVRGAADRKEALALGLGVAIQQHLFPRRIRILRWPAAEQRILPTLDKPAIIGPVAIRRRHGEIVFLYARFKLCRQLFPQRSDWRQRPFRPCVLCLQMRPDIGLKCIGFSHYPLPFVIPQPGIGIVNRPAVAFDGMRPPVRGGGCEGHDVSLFVCQKR